MSTCAAAGAQACTPAGVRAFCIYSPREVLTAPPATTTLCVSRGPLNLTVEGEGWRDWSWGLKQTTLMDNKDRGGVGCCWLGLGGRGGVCVCKGWDSRGEGPQGACVFALVCPYVVYQVLEISSVIHSFALLKKNILHESRQMKITYMFNINAFFASFLKCIFKPLWCGIQPVYISNMCMLRYAHCMCCVSMHIKCV